MPAEEEPDASALDALTLAPLTSGRIEVGFKKHDVNFAVMPDGTVTANWDHNCFFYFVAGEEHEILTVRGDWHQRLPLDLRSQIVLALDEWHRDTRWPKAYTQVDDDGYLWVSAELSVDWEQGVTDGQLHQTIVCAVQTSLSLFEFLGERFAVTVTPRSE